MGIFTHNAAQDVSVTATFPESNPFGVITNGEANKLLIHLANGSKNNYTIVSAAASYHDPARNWALIKNQTVARLGVPLVSGSNHSTPFNVYSQYRPQDLGLTVWVNLADPLSPKTLIPVTAFNQTVTIAEAPSGLLDPSLLLIYTIILGALSAGAYYAWQLYTASSGPKSRTGTRGPGSAKKVAVVPADQSKQEYPAVKPYEEDWIPAHHIGGKAKKRVGKGVGGGVTSGDEVTSGGEATSGAESGPEKKGKRKNKKA